MALLKYYSYSPNLIHISWVLSHPGLAIYRTFAFVFVLYTILLTILYELTPRYLLFATHWNAWLTLAYFAVVVVLDWRIVSGRPVNRYSNLAYILFECAVPISLTIVVLYWVWVNPSRQFETIPGTIASIQNHAGTTVFLLIDLFLNQSVFNPRHIFYPYIVAILYLPVNFAGAFYTTPVYNIVTWRNILTLYVILTTFALMTVFFFFIALLGRILYNLTRREGPKPTQQPQTTPNNHQV